MPSYFFLSYYKCTQNVHIILLISRKHHPPDLFHVLSFQDGGKASSLFRKMREVEDGRWLCYAVAQEQSAAKAIQNGERLKTMQSTEEYLQDLKKWLADTADTPLEEMADFFTKRLHDYEEHMAIWEQSYQMFAKSLPTDCRKLLDLGCGTGLELDRIWQRDPQIEVTGVDLCQDMLDKLQAKHGDKNLVTVCEDYFQYDFGLEAWDAVVSFESLHHFLPEKKESLYQKVYHSLKDGGIFLLGDYIACCDEEEELLRDVCLKKRQEQGIAADCFVHFDIPLTLEHETEIMKKVGFHIGKVLEDPDGATIILAWKKD